MGKGFGENNYLKLFESKNYMKLFERALFEHKKKNFKEAEILYEKLFKLKIKHQLLYFNYGSLLETKENIDKALTIYERAIKSFPNDPNFYSKLGLLKKKQSKFNDAEKLFMKSIELDSAFEFGYINLGNLYLLLGKNNNAEEIYRKVLKVNENSEFGNLNLGSLLMDKGKFKEAKTLFLKAIEINPKCAYAFFSLSKLKNMDTNETFKNNLFCDELLINQNKLGKINVLFARSNINHLEKKFKESKENLELGNSIKLSIFKSDANKRINFSNFIYEEYSKNIINFKTSSEGRNYIFIVGMPRSGSTLVESIISVNKDVYDLGESEAFPLSYKNWIHNEDKSLLFDIYNKKIQIDSIHTKNITDKNLSNYCYTPLILKKIRGSRIIHCYRNPLDNVLSIYRSNFTGGYSFSSSLIDIARVLINQHKLMQTYKKLFPNHICSVDYDKLVCNPELEIKKLTNWLDFEWNDNYLSPHLNLRKVSTTSNVQVRSPINKKSLSGWKNYKALIKPVIDYFENEKFLY